MILTTESYRPLQDLVAHVYDRAKKRKVEIVKQFISCPHILGAFTSFSIQNEMRLSGQDEPGQLGMELGFEYALSRILNSPVLKIAVGMNGNNATLLYLLESNADQFQNWVVQKFPEAIVSTVQEV